MQRHVGYGQFAETAAGRYAFLKPVNDWRQSRALAEGGQSFRCPLCGEYRFVSEASKHDVVLFCTRKRTKKIGLSDASPGRSTGMSDAIKRRSDVTDASQGGSAGRSDARQKRRVCTFAAKARTWRTLPKEGADGDGSRGRTVLDMLGAVARAGDGSKRARKDGAAVAGQRRLSRFFTQDAFCSQV